MRVTGAAWRRIAVLTVTGAFASGAVMEVHFYMNRSSGAIDYGYDYKSVFTGVSR
jgi:hypothetical protein